MIHTHAKFAPIDLVNKKVKGERERRFFTQTEYPLKGHLLIKYVNVF